MKKIFTLGLILMGTNGLFAQNVGIGTPTPTLKLVVETPMAADGIRINNVAVNGDPILQFQTNGTSEFTLGVDDSDADKFKIGTTGITINTSLTIEADRDIAIRHNAPTHMLHMTNGGTTVGGTSMALFENLSVSGVALNGNNTSTTSGYNAIEGITFYSGTGFIPAGVFGLAIYQGGVLAPTIGVRGATNEWQGVGVRGSRFNSGGPDNGWGGAFYEDLGYTGFLGTISDFRTKKDIVNISNATSLIMSLRPVTYQYDLEKYPTMGLSRGMEYGFIAQEVESVIPEITRHKTFDTKACVEAKASEPLANNEEEFVVMDYTRIIPILTKAVQEQQTVIDTQHKEMAEMKAELDALKALIESKND